MNDESSGSSISSINRLTDSPRHQEWVEVTYDSRTVHTWVVYPERSDKAPVVLLIHENKGLSDWVRGMADQVAEAGYIAVAPDLLSGFDATHEKTSDFANDDERTKAINALDANRVQADLDAVATWANTIPASNGRLASAGFCWGGSQSFAFATNSDDLDMALVFYGTGPTNEEAYERISAPVYGFYAGNDARVNATVPQSTEAMAAAGNTYERETYEGAGHAFMRSGEDPAGDPGNIAARHGAWQRMMQLLASLDTNTRE